MGRASIISVSFSLVLGLAVLATPAGAKAPRAVRGKVYLSATPIPDSGRKIMLKRFSKQKKAHLVLTRGKAKVWKATMVAFLKRAPYPGPITIWWYDVADKAALKAKEPAHVKSVDLKGVKDLFVQDIVMDPNIGFNKKRTYRIYVGQIVGKRHRYYAKGTVQLMR
jgi:hypothetical protein